MGCEVEAEGVEESVQGQDLSPVLKNPATRVRESALSLNRGAHSLRNDRWAYLRYRSGEEELYDMQNDPDQITNLATRAEHQDTKRAMLAQLKKRLEKHP